MPCLLITVGRSLERVTSTVPGRASVIGGCDVLLGCSTKILYIGLVSI